MKITKSNLILCIALLLCLISGFGASSIQSSGGRVTVKDMQWETKSGQMLSALLFKPDTATEANPAPAIVVSHGWYNNREMQDLNFVEYSRRGFVVVSIDMYGHGKSDDVVPADWMENGTGMYDAVRLLADLPYVDATRIGVTGHSNGARAANLSVLADDANDKQLISSILLVANDAMYTSDPNEPLFWSMQPPEKDYVNRYGNRSVGIVAAHFDEFFFRSIQPDGSVSLPQNFIDSEVAQSFLYFGDKPEADKRSSATFYAKEIDGKEVVRVIYEPHQTHPWNHFSATVVRDGVQFFDRTLGAPNPIAATNQTWQWKVFFNVLGLAGFLIFIVAFTKFMLKTDFFKVLASDKAQPLAASSSKISKIWFWVSGLVIAVISGYSYLHIQKIITPIKPAWLPQDPVYFIGSWSAFMGIILVIAMILAYFIFAKKEGLSLRDRGMVMSGQKWLKTILLALLVIVCSFLIVFVVDYLFKTDFRIWVLTIKAFDADKIGIALRYLPFFLLFYIPNSIAINVFNYSKLGGKEWLNTAVLALFNGLSVIFIAIVNYAVFFAKGEQDFVGGVSILGIWAIPIAIILPLAAISARRIYKATNNPYLAGFINAGIIVMMSCSNTLTVLMK